ncbi:hypothetical protein D187_001540 [Cystobacter fuscus DSM 2262]|uniref:Uncharacterized protein n=1 Tax=Cystobacter fuscus (strain ATCC 25194 / DSM 2262 / NBRC 100088 / M29) TaxID=1242864 RepID=S9QW31_CYSF2|nr:hypothetical protein D187_001540 [Cystobacter fuscus DSM 2262]
MSARHVRRPPHRDFRPVGAEAWGRWRPSGRAGLSRAGPGGSALMRREQPARGGAPQCSVRPTWLCW